ncbi:error-prone DNA polymerase [Stenotrophomonas aracearum]|jgi:error-prone DNA polymerase|uniref:Error-prone DNA polymerase n=1 Tax=Stenotrophomonas aracearum TaxID=3003272 RepID=A0ABY9Y8M2_9GAMM|nr:error-prone DNA polymerase [Stenotrophomonas sp. A5588]WNH47216.1 error-prone DNA polymerase [Stenotrophomonas sp. A5588]
MSTALPDYAELHCLSAFSFQRGASIAEELFARAKEQGYRALAITDECSMAGIVRAWQAAKKHQLALITGAEFQIEDGPKVVLLCTDLAGYAGLCELITRCRRRAAKGQYRCLREDFEALPEGLLCLWPSHAPTADDAAWLHARFPHRTWLAVELHRDADDVARLEALLEFGYAHDLPLVASGDVHMHVRRRRALQDTLTAIRQHCTIADAGWHLFPNGERHLRSRQALAAVYPAELLEETLRIAERCRFDLAQLQYTYPRELVPEGHDPASWLRVLVEQGMQWRWPGGATEDQRRQIEHELRLIHLKQYESYFLTVHDIVRFARSQQILCQGRGSAANSSVCFVLGVTEIDPSHMELLFERFISEERDEPPDIDIDFEHERREEVLQYVFNRYGRERAALTAVAISYRGRSAVRDVARVLGLPPDQVNELAACLDRWSSHEPLPDALRERGFDPDTPLMQRLVALTAELVDFPRHLSQHPGGFVISEYPLSSLVPVENAAMADRTVIQWDKDDLDATGLMKVDCLALGMLTAVRKCLAMLHAHGAPAMGMADIPADDTATYDMICRADTLGVFQIESRAQMAMLPRMQPRCFYDLVIEVAIVRPGPIQGDMVHPYLNRRKRLKEEGIEEIDYPPELEKVFKRTLGVPLFQEQVMQLAVAAAGFSPGEADALRRSMAAWKRHGGLEPHRDKLLAGMATRGYSRDYGERLFEQIKGFGSYGFPESHAASFALITYVSCWLKCHHPTAFAASLINSQPLGFYTPDQILQDARRHGVPVLPVDVRHSDWDCTLVPAAQSDALPGIRLGLRMVDGFSEEVAMAVMQARARYPFDSVADLSQRARLDRRHQGLLADAGALKGLSGHRHRARWDVSGVEKPLPLFEAVRATAEAEVPLPAPSAFEDMQADYNSTGTTLGQHMVSFIRADLQARRCQRSDQLAALPNGRSVRFAGLVRMRQRPQTASGVTFLTLEDECGMVNAVVWRKTADRQHRVLVEARLMQIDGRLERVDGVQHLIVQRMHNLDELIDGVRTHSRDFH